MRTSSAALFLAAALVAAPAGAQGVREPASDPASLFAAAFSAYAAGNVRVALERYRDAAALGHLPASWKLARMYESGEGVERSDVLAHDTYRAIARRYGSIAPGDRDAVYVASAFVHLGDYARRGIEGHAEPDPVLARRAYFYAATYFGDADAQFELGRMLLRGEGGEASPRNGLRWLKSAADKGDARASAVLGAALHRGEGTPARPVDGLAMVLRAADEVREADREWVAALLADVLATADPAVERTARVMAAGEPDGAS